MMKTVVVTLTLSAVVLSSRVQAQEARFQTGNFSWTPVITLRDAGLDTNVYDEPSAPKRDHLAVLSPEVDGVLELGAASLSVEAGADFVYYQRYTDERSLNKRLATRIEVPLSRIRPFGGVTYLDTRERQNSEIDLRARRTERQFTAGLGVSLTSRASVELGARVTDARYRQGEVFRGVELATRFNRDTTGAAARIRYTLSPLTTFTLEADASRDDFVLSPEFNADNLHVRGGFQFAPDAVVMGRALVGYHKLEPRGTRAFGYDGLTTTVEIGYVLMGRTRFDVRVLRDAAASLEAQPYFVQTTYGGEILHNLFGPVDVIGRASHEWLEYPDLPEQNITAHTLDVNRYGGAVAIRPTDRVRLTFNYEFTERLGVQLPDRHYDRKRLYTTVTYGF
jgi:hypothetical protein